MPFTLTKEYVFPWPVTVHMPDRKRVGSSIEQAFIMTFRLLHDDEGAALTSKYQDANDQAAALEFEKDFIRLIAKGWDTDVVGGDGEPLPFTPENLDLVMKLAPFRKGVLAAYRAASNLSSVSRSE